MTKLEAMLTTLQHAEPESVPCQEDFTDDNARAKFVPSFKTADPLERAVARAEFMDNAMVHVGGGGLRAQTVERTASAYLQQWENGARWTIHTRPQWWRAYDHYPLRVLADLESVTWPDPDDPARYAGVAEKVRYFSGRGYFCQGSINGFFSGVWYFWRPFEEFLVELVEQPRLAHALVDRVGEFNLRMAQHLLECGVHAISFPDDLGYNTALFISPSLYREFFYPWHRRLAELCHSHGAYVNMHSHGNLNAIMSLLVEAGIDILNPVGPSDGMDLAELKARFGERMTFMGGVSKFIGQMSVPRLQTHLCEVFQTGAPGGGFVAFSEGGIPPDMPRANVYLYLLLRRQLARLYGRR